MKHLTLMETAMGRLSFMFPFGGYHFISGQQTDRRHSLGGFSIMLFG